jgi:hypothetical protein
MYGVGWRDLVLVGPLGVFALGDAFEECGLRDPKRPPRDTAGAQGLFQMLPPSRWAFG